MSTAFELDNDGWDQRVADARLSSFDANTALDASAGEGILSGIGHGLARGVVKTVDTAIDVFGRSPAMSDEQERIQGIADQLQDEQRELGLKFWTPSSRDVGAIGQVLGSFSEIVAPLAINAGNPSLLMANAAIQGGKDLVNEGVDATTATTSGVIDAAATGIGFKLPFLGKTLAKKMATGAAGNLLLGAGTAELQHELMTGRGFDELAQNYDPFDVEARAVDALTGLAFGGLDYALAPSQRNAVLAAGNAKHFQLDTAPGRPMDIGASVAHQRAMDTGIEQMLNDEPVSVSPEVMGANFEARPTREAMDEQTWRDVFGEGMPKAPEIRAEAEPARPDQDVENFGLDEPPRTLADDDALLVSREKDESPERVALRDQIVADQLKGAKPVEGRKPIAYVMGGGGASGKGTILARLIDKGLVGHDNVVHVDPDAIKERLPEYKQIVAKGDSRAASAVHEESSALAKRVVAEALAKKTDIVLDRTMADVTKALKEIKALKEAGYEVRLFGVTVDPVNAIRRASDRAKRSGRFVPPKELLKAHKGFAEHFETLAKEVDSARLFNNEVARGQVAPVIASKDSGNALKIQDQQAYNAFRERAKINAEASTERGVRNSGAEHAGNRPGAGQFDARGNASRDGSGGQPLREASSSGDVPAERLTSPTIDAVRDMLAQQDVRIATGEIDADGNPVVRSGRDVMAQADTEFAKAQADAAGIEAAVSCFLTRGFDAP